MITTQVQELAPAERIGMIPGRLPAGERIYAIGDVHGRLDLLQRLIAAIRVDDAARPAARTRLVLLGDLIDRGRSSAQIIELCSVACEQTDRFVVLRGNHEQVMLDSLSGNLGALDLWLRVGGRETLASWDIPDDFLFDASPRRIERAARRKVSDRTLDWLGNLPLSLRIGDYLFVHAGIRPGVGIEDQDPEDLLWIGDEFVESELDHGAVVVHGHTIFCEGVQVAPNRIGIDTGAWRTGRLTALGLQGGERWAISTKEVGSRDLQGVQNVEERGPDTANRIVEEGG